MHHLNPKAFSRFSILSIHLDIFSNGNKKDGHVFTADNADLPYKYTGSGADDLSYSYQVRFASADWQPYQSSKIPFSLEEDVLISQFGLLLLDAEMVNFDLIDSISVHPVQAGGTFIDQTLSAKENKIYLIPGRDFDPETLSAFDLHIFWSGNQLKKQVPYEGNSWIQIQNPVHLSTIEIKAPDGGFGMMDLTVSYKEAGDSEERTPINTGGVQFAPGSKSHILDVWLQKPDEEPIVVYRGMLLDETFTQNAIDRTEVTGSKIEINVKNPNFTVLINTVLILWENWEKVEVEVYTLDDNGAKENYQQFTYLPAPPQESSWNYPKESPSHGWYYTINYHPKPGQAGGHYPETASQSNILRIPAGPPHPGVR